MAATESRSLSEYLRYLRQDPEEYGRLVASFLIKVTEFFRDPAVWSDLRERVLPELITTARARDRHLRVWSAGCATGEEPYSLAMLLCEALGDELAQFTVHIYGTDVDAHAIDFARRGLYSPAAVAGVPRPLAERYFTISSEGMSVVPRVRSLVIFGEHDLGQRPPFPQMDLVLCRNVLIYFTTELQKRALQLFAYALRNGGYLVLGQAEAVTPLAELFTPLQDSLKIYRRQGERILVPPLRPKSPAPPGPLPPIPPLALVPRRSSWRPPPRGRARGVRCGPAARGRGARSTRACCWACRWAWPSSIASTISISSIVLPATCWAFIAPRSARSAHLVTRVPIETLRAALEDAFRPAPLPTTSGQTTVGQTVVVPATGVEAHTTVQLTFYPVADLSPTDAADETVEEGLPADEGEPTEGSRPAGETEAPAEARRPAAVEALFLLVTAGPDLAPDDAATTPSPSRVEPQRSPAGAPPHLTDSAGKRAGEHCPPGNRRASWSWNRSLPACARSWRRSSNSATTLSSIPARSRRPTAS